MEMKYKFGQVMCNTTDFLFDPVLSKVKGGISKTDDTDTFCFFCFFLQKLNVSRNKTGYSWL